MKNSSLYRSDRPVAVWLLAGVFMIIVQVILGGITRLTDSGLSITEWKPIVGTLPPLNEEQWNRAFDHYKQIAQFKHIHSYFTLENFKSIFFWEWLHRNWGRLIGVVFLVPFLIFLKQKRFHAGMVKPMIILFLLGGLQGLIGWIMVKSGLNEENIYVSHIRLAIHFIAALVLLVYTYWFALLLMVPDSQRITATQTKNTSATLIVLLGIQLCYGAFMAGLKAATAAPTWPDINGSAIPPNLGRYAGRSQSFFSALVNDPITIQFIHRNLAYLIFVLVVIVSIKWFRSPGTALFKKTRWIPIALVTIQILLGIATVLTSPYKIPLHWGWFEWNAQVHQFVAILLLLSLVSIYFLQQGKEIQLRTEGS